MILAWWRAKKKDPRDKLLGVWWAASEEDIVPAADAAKGYVSATFSAQGTNFPVIQDIKSKVYGARKGNLEDPARLGNVWHQELRRGSQYLREQQEASDRAGVDDGFNYTA